MNFPTLDLKADLYEAMERAERNPISLPEGVPPKVIEWHEQRKQVIRTQKEVLREQIRAETEAEPRYGFGFVLKGCWQKTIQVHFWPGTDSWEKYGWYITGTLIWDEEKLESCIKHPEAYPKGIFLMECLNGASLTEAKMELLRTVGFHSHEVWKIY